MAKQAKKILNAVSDIEIALGIHDVFRESGTKKLNSLIDEKYKGDRSKARDEIISHLTEGGNNPEAAFQMFLMDHLDKGGFLFGKNNNLIEIKKLLKKKKMKLVEPLTKTDPYTVRYKDGQYQFYLREIYLFTPKEFINYLYYQVF